MSKPFLCMTYAVFGIGYLTVAALFFAANAMHGGLFLLGSSALAIAMNWVVTGSLWS